jgi:molybdate transport system substrate-binding protein
MTDAPAGVGETPRASIRSTFRGLARRWLYILSLTILTCGLAGCNGSRAASLTVAAASSLRTVLPELIQAAPAGSRPLRATYAASGVLRRQVAAGAPVDVMIFAAATPIDRLIASGDADGATRTLVATNRLVLITPKSGPTLRFGSLAGLPPESRLAIGDPRTVPAGRYAEEALQRLGSWNSLQSRLVYGANVAAVLAYARRGEVDGAFVYATDARTARDVVVSDRARGNWAPRPVVGAALPHDARREASLFLDFLSSEQAQRILRAKGFGPPPRR